MDNLYGHLLCDFYHSYPAGCFIGLIGKMMNLISATGVLELNGRFMQRPRFFGKLLTNRTALNRESPGRITMKFIKLSRYADRWWDWTAILLTLVILSIAYSRLIATRWTESLDVTRIITYLGLIAGLALGFSRFSPRWAALFALSYGVFTVPWRVASLFGENIAWRERLISLTGRLEVIIRHLLEQKPVPDNLLFIVLMGIVFWVLSAYAGYQLVRNANQWSVTIPAGVLIVLYHSYDALPNRVWYLAVYLFFSLLIVARIVYLKNCKRWEQNHTYIPPYLGVDFVRLTIIATLVLLLVTWTAPALANSIPAAQSTWQRIKQPWNDVKNTLDNAFASLRSSLGIVADYYGPSLALGRGNRLVDTVVFYVAGSETPPPQGVRFYWRARVYDIYENGWSTTLQSTRAIEPDELELNFPDMQDNAETAYPFAFQLGVPLATLITPYQTVWVSRPARIEYAPNLDGTLDLASLRASPPLRAGEIYQARVSFNTVTIDKLRRAGTDYPEWVRERYLQLPDTISERTFQLANEIAAGEETPYDIAAAVTNYLRDNIEYAETVPALPTDKDLVDWFLFEIKQGFCNYYASAEVVLLRSLGIPARLAVGYAQGEKLADSETYIVRQKDAHAWPEVYFPGIGWVEFEPTVSQPVLVRPLGIDPENSSAPPNIPRDDLPIPDFELDLTDRELIEGDPSLVGGESLSSIYMLILVGLLIVFIILLIPLIRSRRLHTQMLSLSIALENGIRRLGLQPPAFLETWSRRAALSPLARAYSEINLALNRLGSQPGMTDTPAERAASLATVLPPAADPAKVLLREYQLGVYSPNNSGDLQAAQKSSSEIRSLSLKEKIRRLIIRNKRQSDSYTPRFR